MAIVPKATKTIPTQRYLRIHLSIRLFYTLKTKFCRAKQSLKFSLRSNYNIDSYDVA